MLINPYAFGGLWTPARTTTSLWLDASDNATTTVSNGKLTSWADKSGASNTATAISTGPDYLSSDLNSKAVAQFTASAAQAMSLVSAVDINGQSLAIVARHDSATAGQLLSHSSLNRQIRFEATGGEVTIGGASPSVSASTSGQSTGTYYIFYLDSLSALRWYVDGVAYTAGSALAQAFVFNQIGRRSTGSEPLNGRIAEVVWMTANGSTTLRQRVEGYLAHKWGLTANLPADHPYKSTAPTV